MVCKNVYYEGEVTGTTLEGSGIVRIEGFTIFVPMAAPGDRIRLKVVKVLKSYGFGLLDQVLTPSPDRRLVDCPCYRQCGGCAFRHIRYQAELRLKEAAVRDAFQRVGGFPLAPLPIVGALEDSRCRNKAQYPLGVGKDGKIIAGFYARNSHRIIPAGDCLLHPVAFGEILCCIVDFLNQNLASVYNEGTGKGLFRHVYLRQASSTGEILVCLVTTKARPPKIGELAELLREKFPQIVGVCVNVNKASTNVVLGERYEQIWGKGALEDIFLGRRFSISPAAFYQVNQPQAQRLYNLAFDFAGFSGQETLLDLYCGIGSIGLSAAGRVKKLIGVEIVPQAVENAWENARKNGVGNAEFFCGDASAAAQRLAEESLHPDVIILDPPRKGCAPEGLEAVCQMSPEKLVMISCNPATAARDCKFLAKKGYLLEKYQPVDLFPRTGHVETVCLLSKLPWGSPVEAEPG